MARSLKRSTLFLFGFRRRGLYDEDASASQRHMRGSSHRRGIPEAYSWIVAYASGMNMPLRCIPPCPIVFYLMVVFICAHRDSRRGWKLCSAILWSRSSKTGPIFCLNWQKFPTASAPALAFKFFCEVSALVFCRIMRPVLTLLTHHRAESVLLPNARSGPFSSLLQFLFRAPKARREEVRGKGPCMCSAYSHLEGGPWQNVAAHRHVRRVSQGKRCHPQHQCRPVEEFRSVLEAGVSLFDRIHRGRSLAKSL